MPSGRWKVTYCSSRWTRSPCPTSSSSTRCTRALTQERPLLDRGVPARELLQVHLLPAPVPVPAGPHVHRRQHQAVDSQARGAGPRLRIRALLHPGHHLGEGAIEHLGHVRQVYRVDGQIPVVADRVHPCQSGGVLELPAAQHQYILPIAAGLYRDQVYRQGLCQEGL